MKLNITAYFASYCRKFLINKLINLSIYFTTYLWFNIVVVYSIPVSYSGGGGDRLPPSSLKITIMKSCLFLLVQTSAVMVSEFMSLHTSSLYNSPHPHTCFMPRPWHYFSFDNPNKVHVPRSEFNVPFPLLTTYQTISPSPAFCEMDRNMASF
jgi:hypothetical protein